jgi:hypothetical protein
MSDGPIQDWQYWYNKSVSKGAEIFDLKRQIESQQKEIERLENKIEDYEGKIIILQAVEVQHNQLLRILNKASI